MLSLLLAISTAQATSSFYHPNDIAQLSKAFSRASEATSEEFSERASMANALAGALNDYEEGLDLLGSRASAEQRSRQKELRTKFNREFAVVSAFANAMVEDFDAEFSAAMQRAVDEIAPQAVECLAMIPATGALPGMDVPLKANEKCIGQNINQAVAAKMDADAALTAAIDEIVAIEWPSITLEPVAQTPVGGANSSVQILPYIRQIYGRELNIIREQDEMARLPFQTAIEEGASVERLKKLETEAILLTQKTAQKRAELTEGVLDTSDAVLAKWEKKGFQPAGWCAQPEMLGGCGETDRTKEVVKKLLDDPKVVKSARR